MSHALAERQQNGHGRLEADAHGADELRRLKAQLHHQLINGMDLSILGTLTKDQLQSEVRRVADELCRRSSSLLSLAERERLVNEVLDETFGLGPLEPLLKDPAVSDILINGPTTVYVERQVRKRQQTLRQAMPDALDMLVLCLEGGVSMSSAFQRVTSEVQVVHPLLGYEMNIMQREIQLGLSSGEAWKKMGERCGLDDVRDLACVLMQSERFGASVVKALRTYSESWRNERHQRAEETAQKAAVKILFPTLLCIFPAIFVVLLAPAAFQMAKLFNK